MRGVKVGSALPAALHRNKPNFAQYLDIGIDTLARGAHIRGKTILTEEAFLKLSSILEQDGIGEFRADGDFFTFKNKVGNAGPAALSRNVCALQSKVAVFEFGGFPRGCIKLDLVNYFYGRENGCRCQMEIQKGDLLCIRCFACFL